MKRLLAAAFLTSFVSACDTSKPELCGPEDTTGGYLTTGTVYPWSDKEHKICTVDGENLKAGASYHFNNGALVIKGDVPKRTNITVNFGKLFVYGDVGKNAVLSASVPVKTHDEEYEGFCLKGTATINKTTPVPSFCTKVRPVFDAFAYPSDNVPALAVHGKAEKGVMLSSNRGIHVQDIAPVGVRYTIPETSDIGLTTGRRALFTLP